MPSFRSGTVDRGPGRAPRSPAGPRRIDGRRGTPSGPTCSPSRSARSRSATTWSCNTTAVDLGLGTGGWHVVHWNLSRATWSEPGPGSHHEGALHQPPDRHRRGRGGRRSRHSTSAACRSWRARCTARSPIVAAAFQSRPARCPGRVRDDRRRRAADRAVRSRRRHARPRASSTPRSPPAMRSAATARPSPCRRRWRSRRPSTTPTSSSSAWGPASSAPTPPWAPPRSRPPPCSTPTAALGGRPICCVRASGADARPRHRGASHHVDTVLAPHPEPGRGGRRRRRRRRTRPATTSSSVDVPDVPAIARRTGDRGPLDGSRAATTTRCSTPRPGPPVIARRRPTR